MTFSLLVLCIIVFWIFRGTLKKASQSLPEAADNCLQTAVVATAALNKQVSTLAAEATVEQRARLIAAHEAFKALGTAESDETILVEMGLLKK